LSAVPASKKQLITTILNMSGEVADFFTVEEMVTAAENHYGRDFSKQKGVAIALLSLSKQRREIITTNTISPAFYYSAIEQKTDKIVDALLNLAEMNTATLKQLTSWIKDIITRDKTDLSNIISELNSALPLAVESERKQRTGKLKELLFIRRYPNWSHRHEAAENIKKGIRANHQITVEYPPFFEGNALTIRATITAQKDIETVRQEIENASESLTKLLAIVLGEK
ncbi:hypothetical protein KAH37_10490, partial [bacterium]|nr:hypothetical protein [bacterium]